MLEWTFQDPHATKALASREHFVEYLHQTCTLGSDIPAAALIYSELVSNVIRHAPGPIHIATTVDAFGLLTLRVRDGGGGFVMHPRLPKDQLSENGRGLFIVSALCRHLGIRRTANGLNEVSAVLPVVAQLSKTVAEDATAEGATERRRAKDQLVLASAAEPHSQDLGAVKKVPDYYGIFQSLPGMYLILTPDLMIVDATDSYLTATMTAREDIVGRPLFSVFPDNPEDEHATGTLNLRASLARVRATGKSHVMALQRYDVPAPENEERFIEKFWSPSNSPVLDSQGQLQYLIHQVEDVTEFVRQRNGAKNSTRA